MSRRAVVRKTHQQIKRALSKRFAGTKPTVAQVESALRDIVIWLSLPPDVDLRYKVTENPGHPPIVAIQVYNPLTAGGQ